jgi:hypothetical protein
MLLILWDSHSSSMVFHGYGWIYRRSPVHRRE